mgnify:CR=1 FL=1
MRIFSLAGRRLAASIPTLILILVGMFLLLQFAPGDTVDAMMAQMGGGDAAMTYSLDGKETKTEIEGRMGKMPVTLTAKSEGGRLLLTSVSSFSGPMGEVTVTTKESWGLSADGKTLTIDTERTTPRGTDSTTRVFSKK